MALIAKARLLSCALNIIHLRLLDYPANLLSKLLINKLRNGVTSSYVPKSVPKSP